ncbi:MAG: histidinol-phosphate transaminase [marine benthic group bacterium]|nr:histidinol-phosphate transaminase [Gemmatimonadota bacterium]
MSVIRELVRPHVADVPAYVTARSEHSGGILLDANENAFGSPIADDDAELHRYPDPANRELRRAIAGRLRIEPSRLWLGNGSDAAIDLLVRTLTEPGAPVAIPSPSYGVYAQRIQAQAGSIREFRLDESFDLDSVAAREASLGAKLCILCSPNNPTGNLLSKERILDLLENIDGVLAVDEAYVEFAGESFSLAREAGGTGAFERLVVIRTLSKAWGLAGARVGYLVGSTELVDAMDRVGLPYPLSALAAQAALEALECESVVDERIARISAERDRLREGLSGLGLRSLPSDANFVCFFVPDASRIQSRLAGRHGVVVRDRSRMPGLEGALRVTVGTPPENDAFLAALRQELSA